MQVRASGSGLTTVTGTVAQGTPLAWTTLFLEGAPNIPAHLRSFSWTSRSHDPAWNGAQVFLVTFNDPEMRRRGELRGHVAIAHPGGDHTFLAVEGTWSAVSPNEEAWALAGPFVRGTGRFAGITGRWRERVEWRLGGITGEWAATYDTR